MSISSIKGSTVGSFSNVSRSSPTGSSPLSAASKLEGLVSGIAQKLSSGDLKGVVEGLKKLCEALGVDAKKLTEALGLDKAGAEGAGAAEGAAGGEGAGAAEGEGAGAAGGEGDVLEMLLKLLKANPELAKKLLQNPELLKQLAQNPELLKQLAQNPQALQSLASGAPPELAGISQFQAAAAPSPVSLG